MIFKATRLKSKKCFRKKIESVGASRLARRHFVYQIISWLPEFLLSLQVELITNTPSMTSC